MLGSEATCHHLRGWPWRGEEAFWDTDVCAQCCAHPAGKGGQQGGRSDEWGPRRWGRGPHTEEPSLGREKAGAPFGAGNVGDGSDRASPPGSNRTHRRGAPGAPWPTLVVHTLYLTPGRRQDLAEAGVSPELSVTLPSGSRDRPGCRAK